jgi:hypothetical protein
MADIASSDVTYSALARRKVNGSPSRWVNVVTAAFGDGALLYPAGGIPLLKASMGLPNVIEGLKIMDAHSANGYVYKWDKTNNKLRIYQAPNHTHDMKYIGGITATEAVAIQGGDTLGKNAATDRTVAGANSATKGGVVAVAAGALVELGNVALAAASLVLEVSGY